MAIIEAVEAAKERFSTALSWNGHNPDLNRSSNTFKLVVVIGGERGKTGRLYAESLSPHTQIRRIGRLSQDIGEIFEERPDAVILATSNLDAKKALEDIAPHIKKPTTLILPQNGVGIVEPAEEVLASSRNQISIVRASLLTNVRDGENGGIIHNKKRIALSPVYRGEMEECKEDNESVLKSKRLFEEAGFEVGIFDDWKAMEIAKAIENTLGASSAITDLTPLETFIDPKLYDMETRGVGDRFEICERDKTNVASLWGIGSLRLLVRFRRLGLVPGKPGMVFRQYVAERTAAARNNQPSAAAPQIAKGDRKVEPTWFYHRPFVKLAEKNHMEDPVDETIREILLRHEKGKGDFDLNALSPAERRRILLEVYSWYTLPVFFHEWPPVRLVLEGLFDLLSKKFEVSGGENLKAVAETLENGKSVLFTPDHRSHADHVAGVKALKDNLPPEARKYPIYIVAGMKFDKEPISGLFNHGYSHPVVCTLEDGASEEQLWKARVINKRAGKIIEELLAQPSIFVVYLEGSRSRTGVLQKPALHSSWWLLNSHFGLIMPAVIRGTENMLPPGRQIPSRANIAVEFCEGIDAKDFRSERRTVKLEEWDNYFSGKILGIIENKLLPAQAG